MRRRGRRQFARARGQRGAGVHHEWIVQQIQRLRRDGRLVAGFDDRAAIGAVEQRPNSAALAPVRTDNK